jgi:lipoate-protein ligase A
VSSRVVRIDHVGTAAEFHAARPEQVAECTEVHVHELTTAALVVGSTQSLGTVDHTACEVAGIEVVRRRSGGGAVLLTPGEVGWIDVVIPRGAPGWSVDIHAPMVWLGEHVAALLDPDGSELRVHRGRLVESVWSRIACFDGIGAGEILRGEAKLLGISQRRVRNAARLQCSWYSAYEPGRLVDLLVAPRPLPSELRPVATISAETTQRIPDLLVERLAH